MQTGGCNAREGAKQQGAMLGMVQSNRDAVQGGAMGCKAKGHKAREGAVVYKAEGATKCKGGCRAGGCKAKEVQCKEGAKQSRECKTNWVQCKQGAKQTGCKGCDARDGAIECKAMGVQSRVTYMGLQANGLQSTKRCKELGM